jgi:precorrin-6B methylase 1
MKLELSPAESAQVLPLIRQAEGAPGLSSAAVLCQATRKPWPDCDRVELHFGIVDGARAKRIRQILQQPTKGQTTR